MKVIDLSHKLNNNMSYYSEEERAKITNFATYEKDHFNEKKLEIFSHTGTHIDAPYHMIDKAKTLDEYPVEYFMGKALLVDISEYYLVPLEDLKENESKLKEVDFVIFRTGWDIYYGMDEYLKFYPSIDLDCAEYLASLDNIRGIGVDTISADDFRNKNYDVHKTILGSGKIIIENLRRLEEIEDKSIFTLNALPINIENGDGSLTRAIAIIK